ncbi:hypothetical protein LTR85_009300 [Meristemomyces frigidus]|nr:hypothetical protein LTR85_009300 [Meristemomyces frigidus]
MTSPLLGRIYPTPKNLAIDADFQQTLEKLDAALCSAFQEAHLEANTSFSISMFSASYDGLLYERHHSTDLVAKATVGTNKVDGDSMYRLCSISKLLTVYTFLIQAGDRHLNDPITDYLPELVEDKAGADALRPAWEDVTLGDLASHLSGMARDYGLNDLAVDKQGSISGYPRLHSVLPPLTDDEKPSCGYLDDANKWIMCDKTALVSGIANAAPIFPAGYGPCYCNNGYVLLAIALERKKDEDFEHLFAHSLLDPLDLQSSSYSVPPPAKWSSGVIPGNPTTSGWNNEFAAFSPAGGNYMSLKDLSRAVGNLYDTRLSLIPDFDVGFSILTASDSAEVKREAGLKVLSIVSDKMNIIVLPALADIAKERAKRAFAGSYTSHSNGITHSVAIESDAEPGLKLAAWMYNGTDILKELGRPWTSRDQVFDVRLQPNELYGGNKVGFTGVFGGAAWEIVDLFSRYFTHLHEYFAYLFDCSLYGNVGDRYSGNTNMQHVHRYMRIGNLGEQ